MWKRLKRSKAFKAFFKAFTWALNMFFPNPAPAEEGEAYATMKGMYKKVAYYMILVVAGIVGYFVIHYVFTEWTGGHVVSIEITDDDKYSKGYVNGTYSMGLIEMLFMLVGSMSMGLTPFLRYLPKGTVGISTVYFVSVGYTTSFLYKDLAEEHPSYAILTLVISLSLCAIPYILFKYKNITLPRQFSKIVYVLFWLLVMGSSVFKIISPIPGIGYIAQFLQRLYQLPGAGEFLLVVKILIYFLFLFMCIDRLLTFVRRKVPVKYEWLVIFHLLYTVTIMVNWCMTFVQLHASDIMEVATFRDVLN